MERTECSETLKYKLQTPVNHPEESIRDLTFAEIRHNMKTKAAMEIWELFKKNICTSG
jgi:hypothetical protein